MISFLLINPLTTGNPILSLLKRSWVYSDTYNCEKVYSCFNSRQCHLRYNSWNYFCANIYPCGSSCAPLEYHGVLRSYELATE
ncbi:unnamed protein product [Heterobilharzia americana]|nr:unnamed protein product [Heterobilharzia americana]